jgi:hypothetical protein
MAIDRSIMTFSVLAETRKTKRVEGKAEQEARQNFYADSASIHSYAG